MILCQGAVQSEHRLTVYLTNVIWGRLFDPLWPMGRRHKQDPVARFTRLVLGSQPIRTHLGSDFNTRTGPLVQQRDVPFSLAAFS